MGLGLFIVREVVRAHSGAGCGYEERVFMAPVPAAPTRGAVVDWKKQ